MRGLGSSYKIFIFFVPCGLAGPDGDARESPGVEYTEPQLLPRASRGSEWGSSTKDEARG